MGREQWTVKRSGRRSWREGNREKQMGLVQDVGGDREEDEKGEEQ